MASAIAPRAGTIPLSRLRDLILPVGIIASVLVILVPLPAELMDVLLSANISVAVIVLLTTIYVKTPLEFSIFPSLLLATTLGRLVLNVATTRLILTHADKYGLWAAGGVVKIQRTCTCSSSMGVVELRNVDQPMVRSTPSPRPKLSRMNVPPMLSTRL